ncbi:hydrogenase formation protein HypD [candidate division KSB1 bacterium]|nr:hydrogenase formation protein HypD [candidate division KSB1 bacterium]
MNATRTFRDPELIRRVAARIGALQLRRTVRLMEVCGGHTAAIYRSALQTLLPDAVELLSGPGCPVCVTPNDFVDRAILLAQLPGVTIGTFGDLIRVPGSQMSLSGARARGADVRVFYSPSEAVDFARLHPERTLIFLGIGFETTACTVAAALGSAIDLDLRNFKVLSALKTMPAALQALLASDDVQIDGLILPGHVMTVTGIEPFRFIADDLRTPCAVSGFEPLDLMLAICLLCEQLVTGRAEVQNGYGRSVRRGGNPAAQAMISRYFESSTARWRGLGDIAGSGLAIRDEYAEWDAGRIAVEVQAGREHPGCRCGNVLRGITRPHDCPLFGVACTPAQPLGACMVSSEGACAAVYHYAASDVR